MQREPTFFVVIETGFPLPQENSKREKLRGKIFGSLMSLPFLAGKGSFKGLPRRNSWSVYVVFRLILRNSCPGLSDYDTCLYSIGSSLRRCFLWKLPHFFGTREVFAKLFVLTNTILKLIIKPNICTLTHAHFNAFGMLSFMEHPNVPLILLLFQYTYYIFNIPWLFGIYPNFS